MPKKVMLVFGTRPEAIKMAPLCHALLDDDRFETVICVTAQHRHMLDQVLEVFSLKPDYDLDIMTAGQDLSDVTSAVLQGMREVIASEAPDVILVHGDTTTTFATALSGFYLGIPIGHVEAGLRTNDIYSPYPEEFNRQVTSKVTRFHFAPTERSCENLRKEGVAEDEIYLTGNTVIDAIHWVLAKLDNEPSMKEVLCDRLDEICGFPWREDRYVLITGHRRENFGDGFQNICRAIRELAKRHPSTHFLYPVHLNPNVREPVLSILGELENIHLIEPQEYLSFVLLLQNSHIVLTDSGGIQEEAPGLGKPVLVMRDVTERPEAVEAGTVRLVGARESIIVETVSLLLDDEDQYRAMAQAHNPYGDGRASARIAKILGQFDK